MTATVMEDERAGVESMVRDDLLADRMGISRRQLRDAVRGGRMIAPDVRLSVRCWLWRRSRVERFLAGE